MKKQWKHYVPEEKVAIRRRNPRADPGIVWDRGPGQSSPMSFFSAIVPPSARPVHQPAGQHPQQVLRLAEMLRKVNEHNGWVPREFWLEDWEKQAIIAHARRASAGDPC
jgi:hypothetical protein